MKCAAGSLGSFSANCIGTNPKEQGYRCAFCAEVVQRYARTAREVRARRQSVANMVDVKRAHEVQRGWSERAQIIVQDLFIERLNRRSSRPPPLALVMCGSIQRKEACPYSDIDCFALVGRNEGVEAVKLAAADVQNQLEIVGTYWESEGCRIYDGFHFCHGGLSPEKMCATPEGMIDFIDRESEANAHLLDALGGTFFYGKRSLFAERARSYRDDLGKKSVRKEALESLRKYLEPENKDKPYRERENAEFTVIKDRLYRPAQQVIKCVARYFGISDVETRTQVHKLKAAGKLSPQVFDFLEANLNGVAKLRIANHIKWGREYEIVYFTKPARPSAEEAELIKSGKFPLVTGAELRQVKLLMSDSEAIRAPGNAFHQQMTQTGIFAQEEPLRHDQSPGIQLSAQAGEPRCGPALHPDSRRPAAGCSPSKGAHDEPGRPRLAARFNCRGAPVGRTLTAGRPVSLVYRSTNYRGQDDRLPVPPPRAIRRLVGW